MRFTDEELINYLWKFYMEHGRVPRTRDLKKNKDYPSVGTYENRFGTFRKALQKAGLFHLREDKNLFGRHKYTREELLDKLKEFIKKNRKIPNNDDIKNDKNMPSLSIYYRKFGSLNNAIRELGYKPIGREVKTYSDNELIEHLYKLYKKLGRTPTTIDIKKDNKCPHHKYYWSSFGSLYKAFDLAGIPYNKRCSFYSDDEIIERWYNLKYKLNRIPTTKDLSVKEKIYPSICFRWGNYSNFLIAIGEFQDYQMYGCKVYYTSNGVKCFPFYEYVITDFLEKNSVDFIKEVPYNHFILNDRTNRRFDWIVYNGKDVYYIEMFGIVSNKDYYKNLENKIKDCKNNNINLICLYPEDVLRKDINEVLSFCLMVD